MSQAAGLLKRAEGIVTLTLCNPNKKEGEIDPKDGATDGKATAAEEKKPEKPPEPEVPKDPATDKIDTNKDTVIEINAERKPLGIVVVKGDSSQVQVNGMLALSLSFELKLIVLMFSFKVGRFGNCDTREWRRTQRQPIASFRQDCGN